MPRLPHRRDGSSHVAVPVLPAVPSELGFIHWLVFVIRILIFETGHHDYRSARPLWAPSEGGGCPPQYGNHT